MTEESGIPHSHLIRVCTDVLQKLQLVYNNMWRMTSNRHAAVVVSNRARLDPDRVADAVIEAQKKLMPPGRGAGTKGSVPKSAVFGLGYVGLLLRDFSHISKHR